MIGMNGKEKFIYGKEEMPFDLQDFWKYKYSSVYNLQEYIAEYLVEKALEMEYSYNADSWTLFDILYRNTRIEIKQTSYYHPWNEGGKISNQRTFGITMANSNRENINSEENKFERQNDIYVFCLNNGKTKETANPMNLENWRFYIVPTKVINEECGKNKSISLNKVRKIGVEVGFFRIKQYIDYLIDDNKLY